MSLTNVSLSDAWPSADRRTTGSIVARISPTVGDRAARPTLTVVPPLRQLPIGCHVVDCSDGRDGRVIGRPRRPTNRAAATADLSLDEPSQLG